MLETPKALSTIKKIYIKILKDVPMVNQQEITGSHAGLNVVSSENTRDH